MLGYPNIWRLLFFCRNFEFSAFEIHKQSICQWFYDQLTLLLSFLRGKVYQFSFLTVDRLYLFHDQIRLCSFWEFLWNHLKCFVKSSAGVYPAPLRCSDPPVLFPLYDRPDIHPLHRYRNNSSEMFLDVKHFWSFDTHRG